MTDTVATDKKLAQMSAQRLASEKDPLERFKLYALKNGAGKIKTIGRKFKIMDNDGNRKLNKDEFVENILDMPLFKKMERREVEEVFERFDTDGSGCLNYEEFLIAFRPAMNDFRKNLVKKAYDVFDKNNDNKVTVEDITKKYNVQQHPKYQSGEKTKSEILKEFLKNFEAEESIDGIVTFDEFLDYYSGVSASIDEDPYFSLMMLQSWGVKP